MITSGEMGPDSMFGNVSESVGPMSGGCDPGAPGMTRVDGSWLGTISLGESDVVHE